jgi:hypothetical protein
MMFSHDLAERSHPASAGYRKRLTLMIKQGDMFGHIGSGEFTVIKSPTENDGGEWEEETETDSFGTDVIDDEILEEEAIEEENSDEKKSDEEEYE